MRYDKFIGGKMNEDTMASIVARSLPADLFDFQKSITSWALTKGRAAIFADCGMGKTIMQLAWASNVPGRTIILAPLAVAAQTIREAARFGVSGASHVRRQDDGSKIIVTNYEMLDHFNAADFDAVVLDESSILKSFDGATRTKLIDAFSKTKYRLACTATPAPNDFMELGNHSEFLGIMTRAEMLSMFFIHDGGETQKWRLKKHADSDGGFWKWCASWSVMIRKPSDVGYDDGKFALPPLSLVHHTVRAKNTSHFLFPMPAATLSERLAARRDTVDGRCSIAADIANSHKGKVVVWCNLNKESKILASKISGAVEVVGSDSWDKKESSLASFSDPANMAARVLVTKPSIAGFGVNWQHCHKMVFAGLSDSYEQFYQAIRRCWRFGQKKDVCVDVVAADTEGAVVENIKRKEANAMTMARKMVGNMSEISKKELHKKASRTVDKYATKKVSGDGWEMLMGDCVDVTNDMDEASIDYAVYSPPFASLYTYSANARDMGNCKDHGQFFEHYQFLIEQLLRVLKPGRLVSFHCMNLPTTKTRDGYIGISDFRGKLIASHQAAGFIYHSEVVIWKDPVTAMQRTKALGLLHKQLKKDSCMSRQGIPDYVVTMRKPGENANPVQHTNETYPVGDWQKNASPIWTDISPSDTLQFRNARDGRDERHICPLQLEVIRRCLRLWSNPGDLVLSPFAGIGSEGWVSLQMGRRFVGVELKKSYFDEACKNVSAAGRQLNLVSD